MSTSTSLSFGLIPESELSSISLTTLDNSIDSTVMFKKIKSIKY